MGLSVWGEDEAGPYQTRPYEGSSWEPQEEPGRQPHEYFRDGTGKLLTLFHPSSGEVRVKGVRSSVNEVGASVAETRVDDHPGGVGGAEGDAECRGEPQPMEELAGGVEDADNVIQRVTPFEDVAGAGQSEGALHTGVGAMDVRTRSDAFIHSIEW